MPLARAGKLAGASVHVVGMTGSSGSGVAPTAGTHHPVRAVNLKPYKVLEHQHTPEILETLAAAGAPGVELRLRAGVGAAVARDPGHQLRRAARRHDRRSASPRCTPTRTRASRSCASCAIGRPRWRRSRAATTPRSASRWARAGAATDAHAGDRQRDRQPDQGRRRSGDPEHEPDAGPARDDVAGGSGTVAVAARWRVASTRSSSWGRRARAGEALADVAAEIARARAGRRLLVVHGGGPQATALARRLGHRVAHRRRPARHRRADARRDEDGGRRAS